MATELFCAYYLCHDMAESDHQTITYLSRNTLCDLFVFLHKQPLLSKLRVIFGLLSGTQCTVVYCITSAQERDAYERQGQTKSKKQSRPA